MTYVHAVCWCLTVCCCGNPKLHNDNDKRYAYKNIFISRTIWKNGKQSFEDEAKEEY
jgi:hypothetical protein